ncbi:MAG: diguanylate cyclase [Myxococcales bacterium]|nr:diguanylate cyclase [Myxococcales bacterium]
MQTTGVMGDDGSDTIRQTNIISVPPYARDANTEQRQGTLTVLVGVNVGQVHTLGDIPLVIGRDAEADLRIEDTGASRRHARILPCGDHFEIEDMASTNGTYLEASRLVGSARLLEGARILIGSTVLRFAMQDAVEQRASRQMYELSVRDGLTGLYNRRHFDERLRGELAFAKRHRAPLSVLLLDVDHFKQVNDVFGHPVGDVVLQKVGQALRLQLRIEDLIARYGGEEFAVVARAIEVSGAHALAERLRTAVENLDLGRGDVPHRVTISIGVASQAADGITDDPEALLIAADAALYAAKHAGRNCVRVAGEVPEVARDGTTAALGTGRRGRSRAPTATTQLAAITGLKTGGSGDD